MQGNDSESRPHILIVDDEFDIRHVVSLCLEKNGLHTSCADDVAAACRLLLEEPIDIIVSDVMMPGEDGISFLARVHEYWPEIPVILMTGHAELQMAVDAIKSGAFDFIYKPLDFELLSKIVERAVKYSKLQKLEKNYRAELEETVVTRTAELRKAMQELDAARSALLKAATEKTEFMTTITHEMRTPMNGVIGSLDLLAGEALAGAAAEYLAMARKSADEMVAMIDHLLTYTQSNCQIGTTCYDMVDLATLMKAIVSGHQPLFKKKGLALSLQISDDVPERIWTDKDQLARLLEIIVANAFKFTERGGVQLEVSRQESGGDDSVLLISVKDSGIGIPEERIERIFDPFVQGDGSFSRRHEGVGLGLAIARQIAMLLGGRLWAERLPDGGSCFLFRMNIVTP